MHICTTIVNSTSMVSFSRQLVSQVFILLQGILEGSLFVLYTCVCMYTYMYVDKGKLICLLQLQS